MDGFRRTCAYAFATQAALGEVDICQVVFHGNGTELAFFGTFAAADAGSLAGFPCDCPFVFIDAADENPSVFRTFVAEFDNVARTGFDASTASYAFFFIDDGQPRCRIQVDGIKLAGIDTVSTPQATESAGGFANIQGVHDGA